MTQPLSIFLVMAMRVQIFFWCPLAYITDVPLEKNKRQTEAKITELERKLKME
jgi:hypothetical protein